MFTLLAQALAGQDLDENDVFKLHPLQLLGYMEALWGAWRDSPNKTLPPRGNNVIPDTADAAIGHVRIVGISNSPAGTLLPPLRGMFEVSGAETARAGDRDPSREQVINAVQLILRRIIEGVPDPTGGSHLVAPPRPWQHLMYAYLIRNTRIVEVFQRLLHDALHSERLSALSPFSHRFLRTTEALFFRRTETSLIASITSDVRPDVDATQRNAFYRMFGFDLTHGAADGRPYAYEKPEVANRNFGAVFQHFLREVWKGYINAKNTSGPKTADDAAILYDIERLKEMMRDRRQGGLFALAREEFVSVAIASWFDFAVESDTPIVVDLKATASTPEERLHLLGKRVQVSTHANADSLFELAKRLPLVLTMIEEDQLTTTTAVQTLYTPGNALADDMLEIINHWSRATNTDIKSVPVTSLPAMAGH